ncbi:GOB family subclass B3 metallo-beta-lactamase [Elizabethkingia meningoseptica]|uniref:GOB family subclass B3 metallo-beta-lactamase n=1 Tax=Elizabethkingia meningoseptica TaxID=238 RepID=UPI0022F148B2|nr:GOB family subclass B3 metallo-beta-lactamase [Elizabethkingia meningoseptica]EJK5329383.1 GOB family subclass B3 metallo-beta-lactamase [Elizabethkingia meningoseptica]EJK5330843.1 GOB family subclass B3 metallo-beta-lactamase [Elizabethkingia meningoseptica]MDE5469237.1 GOB family subclass B3 metallo-beta-lactamase [Elizabethkingia meningoseptica]MDE5475151.1 GOB family subclass B3 metallo-beta-lactamase [Elizabethkingia meningoseptica]MDE5478584.1 GOB family subclass B3 metallo-beta-lact
MRNFAILFFLLITFSWKAQVVKEPENTNEEWSRSYEPFRIAGNLYYVGTYDLASYLIVSDKGNILINTGLAGSLPMIKENIKKLGFNYKDIKILLLTQAHYDHTGALKDLQTETGAKFYADSADADVLKTGGKSDYEMGKYGATFKPIKPDILLKDQDKIKLGNTTLTLLHHPGHTKGSCSFIFETKDENRNYKVLIANMPSVIVDRKFSEIKDYPNIQADYAYTFKAMKKLDFDLWVASHASQFDLHTKHKEGDPYNPQVFMDKANYFAFLNSLETDYLEKIKNDSQKK